jgi:hypothetical protein
MPSRSKTVLVLILIFMVSVFSVAFLSCSGKVACAPQCDGKQCGDDNCGGSCLPGCDDNETCNAAGQCICTPQCDGLQCGDDKCGGNCGLCEDPAICQEGQCILPGECQPSCDIAQCRVCFQYTCESLCHGSEVCNDGICEEPICDPPCDGNTKICSNSVCKTFAELKNEYIGSHPGQALIPYPWEPITSTRVLPFGYEVPAAPGNIVSISACRGEFEPASFVITAQKDLSGITLDVPNLSDAQGNTIPSSAIDVRLIKVWYQAAPEINEFSIYGSVEYKTAGYYLTPELLLKDDSLVSADYVNKVNTLKVTINNIEQYFNISDPDPQATLPPAAQVRDATTLQPFSLKETENKQVWITVRVPSDTPTGIYAGKFTLRIPSETPVTMNFRVIVLPFGLEPAPIDYGLYYQSDYVTGDVGFSTTDRTPASVLIELQDMKDHGVLYPTFYQHSNDVENIDSYLTLRDTVGFPKDKIYTNGGCSSVCPSWTGIGNASDPSGLATIANKVVTIRNLTGSHGYADTYFYGIDEAKGDELLSQRLAWETVHASGGKIWASGHGYELIKMVDILDAAIKAYELVPAEAAEWHRNGKWILSYANPQSGVENPEIYRKNYGAALWNAGYDGAMDFAYQIRFGGSIWNDYDDPGWVTDGITYHYRDHVFAYPTSNGVIDTIQWEGWREGVDDTRYVATLKLKMNGDDTLARSIVTDSLSKNESMSMLRKRLIKEILSH